MADLLDHRYGGEVGSGSKQGLSWEKILAGAVILFVLVSVLSQFGNSVSGGNRDSASGVRIAEWSWKPDSDYTSDGAVIWQGRVHNESGDYIEHVRVEFTTFDGKGNVVDTDFTYASGLSPGGNASFQGYATYFGTEARAEVRIVDHF